MELTGGIVVVSLPLLAMSFGAEELELGCLCAYQRIPYVVLCLGMGWLSDRVGRKILVAASCVGLTLTHVLLCLATDMQHVYLLAMARASTLTLFWPPVMAWVSELPVAAISRRASFFNMSWSLGATFGCLAGGLLAQQTMALPFGASAVLSGFLLLTVLAIPGGRRVQHTAAAVHDSESDSTVLGDAFLYASWVGNFATFASVGIVFGIFPKLAVSLGFSAQWLGLFFFVYGCSRTVTFFARGRTDRWHFRLRPLMAAQCAGVAGLLLVSVSRNWLTIVPAFVLMGCMSGTSYGASLFYCLHGGRSVGRRSGLHEGILVAGSMVGGFLGGVWAECIHPRAPYAMIACVVLIGCGTQALIVTRARRRSATP